MPQAEPKDKSIPVIKEKGIIWISNACNKLSIRNPLARKYLQNVLKANTDLQVNSKSLTVFSDNLERECYNFLTIIIHSPQGSF